MLWLAAPMTSIVLMVPLQKMARGLNITDLYTEIYKFNLVFIQIYINKKNLKNKQKRIFKTAFPVKRESVLQMSQNIETTERCSSLLFH